MPVGAVRTSYNSYINQYIRLPPLISYTKPLDMYHYWLKTALPCETFLHLLAYPTNKVLVIGGVI